MTLPWYSHMRADVAATPAGEGFPDIAGLDTFDPYLRDLPYCPVALSETYVLAHQLPMVIMQTDFGPEVMWDLRPDVVRNAPFDEHGRWRLAHKPISLRILPFNVTGDGQIESVSFTGPEQPPLGSSDGIFRKPQLQRYLAGRRALTARARFLSQATLQPEAEVYSFDLEKLKAMAVGRLNNLEIQSIRLAILMKFSNEQRRMVGSKIPSFRTDMRSEQQTREFMESFLQTDPLIAFD